MNEESSLSSSSLQKLPSSVKKMGKILVVEEDPHFRSFLIEAIVDMGGDVVAFGTGDEEEIASCDLCLVAEKKPHFLPSIPFIVMGESALPEKAVEAMRQGAIDYLPKPFSAEALKKAVERVRNQRKRESAETSLIAASPPMQKLLSDLKKIAKSQASVFITGESGTGKEVLASEIHRHSLRAHAPFIRVNCAAIAETLLESEFFGHEKGAFTGAHMRRPGRFELADQGTLLLDEVTEIPLSLQAKLLRAIQEQTFERVGGTKSIGVNVRFLATSNRNMQEAIENKVFREDLFYRLNVVPLHIAPLRERQDDILPLAQFFLEKFCRENGQEVKTFSPKAIDKLLSYSWPGNVRELANIVERTVVLDFAPIIEEQQLYLDTSPKAASPPLQTLYEVEKSHILKTLELLGQNRTRAASCLGISIRTLRNKLSDYTSQ